MKRNTGYNSKIAIGGGFTAGNLLIKDRKIKNEIMNGQYIKLLVCKS